AGIGPPALLREAHDPQILRALDLALRDYQSAGQHVEQGRLAAAVGADQAHARARRDHEVEGADEPPAAARYRQAASGQQPPRAALRRAEVDAGGGGGPPRAPVLQLLDQAPGLLDAPLGLGRPRLRSATQPFDLAPYGVGQRVLVGRLAAQELVAAREELAVGTVRLEEAAGIDAVELEHPRGDVLQKVPVMAHDDERPRPLRQHGLQPQNALD